MEFPTFTELRNAINAQLEASGLTDVSNAGSASDLLVGSFTAQMSRVAGYTKRVFSNSFIHNAAGIYLDIHGEELGIRRREALPAVVFAEDKVLRFKATSGTLRDKLGSTISAGTTVSNPESTVSYTIAETNIAAGVTELFVTAIANNTGTSGNVNANELTVLSIETNDVEVTNIEPINTGTGRETDREYRGRLLAVVQGNNSSSEGTIIASALVVPGVTFATIIPNAFGINHPALLISGADRIRSGLAARVESAVRPLLPFGARITVLTPRFRELELTLVVSVRDADKNDATKARIRQIVMGEFFPHTPGTQFPVDRIDGTITRQIPSVLDVEVAEIILDGSEYGTSLIRTTPDEQLILTKLVVELV